MKRVTNRADFCRDILMVKGVIARHYHDVTRYTSGTFLRMQLREALVRNLVVPHLCKNKTEALGYLPPSQETS